ncbi:transketolase [candidate division GN15 bacterium]|uniref:Transketolase n=1 Tax=candidate division GN15 bacterium TaxID=2072418 RepID=A0A855XCK3_9BACT|nr:MAG: transketolase [candidate division GN15 bacterium]
MPLVDSHANQVIRDYSIDQLKERANYMRGLNLTALCSAGSGHSGGTLGVMDIAAALYLKVARHDPKHPSWDNRDRMIWSAGHKAPALYTALAVSGYFDEIELAKLRMLGSPLQGHPHRLDLPGVEISSGSLGQGCSVAVGVALAAKLNKADYRVFVVCSDGEHQEGSVWEAVMAGAHHRLDNLVFIVDQNRLQIDGPVADVLNIEPLAEKYRSFGWQVMEVDGHNMAELVTNLENARNQNVSGKPTVLICRTIKGRGVTFMENVVGWHGKPPNREELDVALRELGLTRRIDVERFLNHGKEYQHEVEADLEKEMPKYSRSYWWNAADAMKVEMQPTRVGFGRALDKFGDDERIVCIGADISDSICISDFHKQHPERKSRFISVGIAEQNATTIAAGLAKEGKIPVFGTYGVFASARNLDQLRVSVCYGNFNVLVAGAHGGISVGPDGATHQELEALFQICGLPNMHVGAPCDAIETEKMTRALLFEVVGPKYLRFAREATPMVTSEATPFRFGEANIIRFRSEGEHFRDAFETRLAGKYLDEHEDLTILSCGPELAEAMRAAYILKAEHDIETRIINMHTVKPIDREAVMRAARETRAVITAEEHQVGGLGNRVAGIILEAQKPDNKPVRFAMIGVGDRFGESGRPWQLIRKYGLSAEHIAEKAIEVLGIK